MADPRDPFNPAATIDALTAEVARLTRQYNDDLSREVLSRAAAEARATALEAECAVMRDNLKRLAHYEGNLRHYLGRQGQDADHVTIVQDYLNPIRNTISGPRCRREEAVKRQLDIDADSTPQELEERRNSPAWFDWYCRKCKLPLVDQECGGNFTVVSCPICDGPVTDQVMRTDE